jgi:hypothetical protein
MRRIAAGMPNSTAMPKVAHSIDSSVTPKPHHLEPSELAGPFTSNAMSMAVRTDLLPAVAVQRVNKRLTSRFKLSAPLV